MDSTLSQIICIEDYRPEHGPAFAQLNRAWIEQYFRMETIDRQVLEQPEEYILKAGGAILMARYGDEIAGTVALKAAGPAVYEFTKMAVAPACRGKGIGLALSEAAIGKARQLGANRIILYSNTVLAPAIRLYRKLGFTEVPVDGTYERCNIKMELTL